MKSFVNYVSGLNRLIIIIIIIIRLLEKYILHLEWAGNGRIHIELYWQKKTWKTPIRERQNMGDEF